MKICPYEKNITTPSDVINPDFLLLFKIKLNAIQITNVIKITNNIGMMISSGTKASPILVENRNKIGNIENKIGCNSVDLVTVFIITVHLFP